MKPPQELQRQVTALVMMQLFKKALKKHKLSTIKGIHEKPTIE
jgi:hypothetical protein